MKINEIQTTEVLCEGYDNDFLQGLIDIHNKDEWITEDGDTVLKQINEGTYNKS